MAVAEYLSTGVRIAQAHPAGLVALAKPEGYRSHPNQGGTVDPGALLALPYDEEAEAYVAPDQRFYLLNRLDAPTSGLILLASDAAVAADVKARFAGRDVEKIYLAVVKGRLGRARELWNDRLLTQSRGGQVRTHVHTRGEPASCEAFQRAQTTRQPLLSLVELHPHTGRTHQLRVQCASRHLPIVGDATYGDFRYNKEFAHAYGEKRLMLHASEVRLKFRAHGKEQTLQAKCETPAAMLKPFA